MGKTFPGQRRELLENLARVMEARAEEIVEWLIRESGSTRLKAGFEWHNTLQLVRSARGSHSRSRGASSAATNRVSRVLCSAKHWGCGGYQSLEFPLYLSMRSVVPAIALGNTVVLKPASDTAVSGGLLIAHMFEEAGFPAG